MRHPKATGAKARLDLNPYAALKGPLFHVTAEGCALVGKTHHVNAEGRALMGKATTVKSCRSPRGTSHETEPGNGHRTANPPDWMTV